MAQVPLREHYASDEEYQTELDIYLTNLDSDVENMSAGMGTASTGTDDEAYPTVDDLRIGYQERYLATRYGTSATGADFTDDYTTIVGLTVFQGLRNSNVVTESTNPADYTWRELNVVTGWIPSYRIAGGRLVDWDFSTTTPTNYIVDNIAGAIDLDNFGTGATGPAGRNSISVNIRSNIGTAFRNSAGSPATVVSDVRDGGVLLSDTTHALLSYKWTYNNNTVCVMNDRSVINGPDGNPLVSVNGTTCSTGVPADSSVTTSLGGALRSITIGPEDVHLMAGFGCDVTNIPD